MIPDSCHSLTLYLFPSPRGIDWATPSAIARSAVWNHLSFKDRKIGHVAVGLREPGADKDALLTGMTDTEKPYAGLVLRNKAGFGVLWQSYGGRLEEADTLAREISTKWRNGRLSLASWKISPELFQHLMTYAREYRERGGDKHYGLANRPRHDEGAGCSAFGVSFLDVAGLLDDELNAAWQYRLRVPEALIGTPVSERRVGILRLLTGAGRWATADEDAREIVFWDPDSMHRWARAQTPPGADGVEVVDDGPMRGVIFDRRDAPVPDEPVWRA